LTIEIAVGSPVCFGLVTAE